ncbi:hypothetical protein OIDMADRAFT_17885 [Oidiodendron maius Zn]|uniref:Uncharacterized protein n=1 Tax=Oidiodendron maius (strain Zn) TaxID=913774 RepID=A0A0C3HSS8_OIDMZ|nr:hypothetical protein OIDMADRAFT_17885 [Oidiodendron maius Zn]
MCLNLPAIRLRPKSSRHSQKAQQQPPKPTRSNTVVIDVERYPNGRRVKPLNSKDAGGRWRFEPFMTTPK